MFFVYIKVYFMIYSYKGDMNIITINKIIKKTNFQNYFVLHFISLDSFLFRKFEVKFSVILYRKKEEEEDESFRHREKV